MNKNIDINSQIEYWHTHDTKNSLREFLGMSKEEYENFIKNGDKIESN